MADVPLLKSGRRHDEPPEEVRYWRVRSEGELRPDTPEPPEGVRTTIVGAGDPHEAQEIVELIERQHADEYGGEPWKVVEVFEDKEHDVATA